MTESALCNLKKLAIFGVTKAVQNALVSIVSDLYIKELEKLMFDSTVIKAQKTIYISIIT